jgi:DNA-binding transcriptional LysR family regulator
MLPELKISQLRYFLMVVEHQSYHAAARHAHRTQPAISLAVRELEQKLSQPLFEKGGRAQLTPFGEHCLPLFRGLLEQHDRIAHELHLLTHHEIGKASIAAVPSVASRVLPKVLAAFVREHPKLQISIQDANADTVQALVSRGEVDFGISSLWSAHDQLSFTALWDDRIGVVCRRDHPLAARYDSLRWEQLVGLPFIRNGTSRLLEQTQAAPLLENSPLFVSNMISLIAMLEEGVGITTLPELAHPADNQLLVFIPLVSPNIERRIGIIQQAGRSLSVTADGLLQHIINSHRPV